MQSLSYEIQRDRTLAWNEPFRSGPIQLSRIRKTYGASEWDYVRMNRAEYWNPVVSELTVLADYFDVVRFVKEGTK